MKNVTIISMGMLGFPVAILAAEAVENSDGTITFREPRARKTRTAPKTARIVAGDQRAAVKAAVWVPTEDGRGERSRYHGFAPEWDGVLVALIASLGGSPAGVLS